MIPQTPAFPLPAKGHPALLQAFLSCFLMFLTGSSFALGVFTVAVEQVAAPKGALAGVWPSAMGVMHFASAPVMILTGLFLDGGAGVAVRFAKTARVRVLAALSSAAYAAMFLAGLGAARSSAGLVTVAVGLQSVPLGINYLLTTELLVSWIPERPGLAVGCGQMAFGIGSITFAAFFSVLLQSYGCVSAIYISAMVLTASAILPTILLRWPDSYDPLDSSQDPEEREPLLMDAATESVKIPWTTLLLLRPFWLYIAVVFTAGAGYAFVPYFFKLGSLFHQHMRLLVKLYQVISLLATVLGLLGSMWTDSLGHGDGYWFSGSRNLFMMLLTLQTVLFLCLIPLSSSGNFAGFVVVVAVIIVMLAAHAGCGALLARDLFGPANSCIVYGIGGGLAMGSGEGLSAEMMSSLEAARQLTVSSAPSEYNLFYVIAAAWSFAGLLCILSVERCGEAFDYKKSSINSYTVAV